MSFKPIKTSLFIKFLLENGCIKVLSNNGGSHSYYKKSGAIRRVVIRENDKEIPPFHVKTNLETLGLKMDDFENWLNR
jgi:predicted RNA binding protein YcfA (HicA-like mRNA interferase family)